MTFKEARQKATTWIMAKVESRGHSARNYSGVLVDPERSPFGLMEPYRQARTNILYTGICDKEGGTIIGVTSALSGEGKSLTCANLAITFGHSGKKVLIVDGDMHDPAQFAMFSTNGKLSGNKARPAGLSEYLAGVVAEPDILPTLCENVSLLSAGKCPSDTAGLLGRPAFASLMGRLRGQYDFIFLDLPLGYLVSDAAVVGKQLTGYLLVTKAGYSEMHLVQETVATLQSVGGRMLGFILNGVQEKSGYDRRRRKEKYADHLEQNRKVADKKKG